MSLYEIEDPPEGDPAEHFPYKENWIPLEKELTSSFRELLLRAWQLGYQYGYADRDYAAWEESMGEDL